MDKPTDINLRGALIAQTYLIEFLLHNLLHQQNDPAKVIESMRFHMTAQLRDDSDQQSPIFLGEPASRDLADAASHQLGLMLDRLHTQFSNPAVKWSQA